MAGSAVVASSVGSSTGGGDASAVGSGISSPPRRPPSSTTMIAAPISSTTMAKVRLRTRSSRRRPKEAPATLPIDPIAENRPIAAQSMPPANWCRYSANPAPLLIAITTRLVPTATDIVRPPSITSAGTMRKPPPTPTKPVRMPTPTPSSTIQPRRPRGRRVPPFPSVDEVRRPPRSIATAAAIMTAAKVISCTSGATAPPSHAPPAVPTIAGTPKKTTLRQSTAPRRIGPMAPTAAIAPTIARLSAIANSGAWPSR